MIKTKIKMKFYPTESEERLHIVIRNFYDSDEYEHSIEDKENFKLIIAEKSGIESIKGLYDGFRKQRTVQTARSQLFNNIDATSTVFMLHKQALFVGRYHFAHEESESPLGPVRVMIESDDIQYVLEYLVPMTQKGVPLEVSYVPE